MAWFFALDPATRCVFAAACSFAFLLLMSLQLISLAVYFVALFPGFVLCRRALHVAQELRDEGHTIEETDDPKALCRDISNALKTPSGTSFPLTKTLVTALLLFGFASPAEALQSGKQVCAPTVCMLNGGKDLTRSTYMKEYVAPNHPDKGGDLETSQFFNDCGRELFQDSSTMSCQNVRYDKSTEKAVNKYIAGASKREEASQKKEKEHVSVKGRLEFINDPEVMEDVNKVKKILQQYGFLTQAINSRSLDISVQDANVIVANMKSFIQQEMKSAKGQLEMAKKYKLELETKLEKVKKEQKFAETYLQQPESKQIELANPDMPNRPYDVQTSIDIRYYTTAAWSWLETLSVDSLRGLQEFEEYVTLARKYPRDKSSDDPPNGHLTPYYTEDSHGGLTWWVREQVGEREQVSENRWVETWRNKKIPDSVTAKALEIYFRVLSEKHLDMAVTYQSHWAIVHASRGNYAKQIEDYQMVIDSFTESYEIKMNATSDFLKRVESYENRFGPVVSPSLTTHAVAYQWDEVQFGILLIFFMHIATFSPGGSARVRIPRSAVWRTVLGIEITELNGKYYNRQGQLVSPSGIPL